MKIHKKTLKNGLRVIALPMKDSLTATVLVLVEAGSDYEEKSENGISHFLEHMCFKGTEKRTKSIDISHELDAVGAVSNAFTSNEFTGYYAKAHAKHLDTIFDVVSDLYLNPTLPATEIEKEKGVIIEEMNMYEDLPQRAVHEVFKNLMYGDQPAGRTILGDREVILSANRETFINYRKKHYVPQSTVVVISGNIDPKMVFEKTKNAFGSLEVKPKSKKKLVKEAQKIPALAFKHKASDQAHLLLGIRTFGTFDKQTPVLDVLNAVLGEGMSSRLFQKIREELGVAYYVKSMVDYMTDHGFFAIAAGVDKKRTKEVVSALIGELKLLTIDLVPERELAKAKESLLGGLAMSLESSDSFAEFAGLQEVIKGSIETPKEYERKIRAVTAEEVRKLARKIFVDKNLNLAIIGSSEDEKDLRKILRFS
jgi:predicted Zn-dependent peptidase